MLFYPCSPYDRYIKIGPPINSITIHIQVFDTRMGAMYILTIDHFMILGGDDCATPHTCTSIKLF